MRSIFDWTRCGAGAVVALLTLLTAAMAEESSIDVRTEMSNQASRLGAFVASPPAREFLEAVEGLPGLSHPRTVYYDKTNRSALTAAEAAKMDASDLEGFERTELDERFYYYTRYGTPLAFVRPLDLLGRAGLAKLDGVRIADFGFGTIGHLLLMADRGAEVTGIEVDPLLDALYSERPDGRERALRLLFGRFPADPGLVDRVGGGFDLFVSKNTLKRGYIHPEQEVDPRRLVQLGVDDETFVRAVATLLEPGGYFLIYNLHPAQAEDPAAYKPWADGRSPFDRELLEKAGFEVLAFDRDDSAKAREMGRLLGWSEQMDLDRDLFGTYSLARKR